MSAKPIMFQTDGQWWFVWRPGTAPGDVDYVEDAYTTADDGSDTDCPRAAIVNDVFRRFNAGAPCEYIVVDRGVKIGPEGWPEGGAL